MLTCSLGGFTLDGVDTVGYSGDVWDEQLPSKDHPWKKMPKQAMIPHTSGTTLDAQVLPLFCAAASYGVVQSVHDCLCTVLQLCLSAAVMCTCAALHAFPRASKGFFADVYKCSAAAQPVRAGCQLS
jgi:hypothetical protein